MDSRRSEAHPRLPYLSRIPAHSESFRRSTQHHIISHGSSTGSLVLFGLFTRSHYVGNLGLPITYKKEVYRYRSWAALVLCDKTRAQLDQRMGMISRVIQSRQASIPFSLLSKERACFLGPWPPPTVPRLYIRTRLLSTTFFPLASPARIAPFHQKKKKRKHRQC